MEYTKGEWRAYKTDTFPDRWTICAGDFGERGICKTVLDNFITPEDKEANANLIAAAPEMYIILSDLAKAIDENKENIGVGREMRLRQALAKAEGK